MVIVTISEVDIYNALSSLNVNKASGNDGIGPKILNHCATSLFKPLHYLFSLCLRKHTLPPDWLIHTIVPIYKSGDKLGQTLVNNYRPISLLCNVSKVLKRLVYDKVLPHIQSLSLLDNFDSSEIDHLFNNYYVINAKNQTDTSYLPRYS